MYLPIMIDVQDKNILIVGGGKVAYSKALSFYKKGGRIILVSPEKIDEFEEIENIWVKKEYDIGDLEDVDFVIAATDSSKVNNQIAKDCKSKNILVSLVDSMDQSDFIMPSIIGEDGLIISVSTGGRFPTLAKKVRLEMEERYSKFDDEYLNKLEDLRKYVLENCYEDRRKIFKEALDLSKEELDNYIKDLVM